MLPHEINQKSQASSSYYAGEQPRFQGATIIGANGIFLSFIPFCLATALQFVGIQTALIAGTASAGGVILFGMLMYYLEMRQIRVYIMDVAMLACMAVQLGVQFRCSDAIADNFDFITNGSLAVLMLISLVLGYPFAIQHVRETVPRASWRQGSLKVASLWSTVLFIFVFIVNTLLYLIPVAKGLLDSPTSPLNYVFRIILPIVFFFLAAVITRLLPVTTATEMEESQGFDGSAAEGGGLPWRGTGPPPGMTRIMVNPLAA